MLSPLWESILAPLGALLSLRTQWSWDGASHVLQQPSSVVVAQSTYSLESIYLGEFPLLIIYLFIYLFNQFDLRSTIRKWFYFSLSLVCKLSVAVLFLDVISGRAYGLLPPSVTMRRFILAASTLF